MDETPYKAPRRKVGAMVWALIFCGVIGIILALVLPQIPREYQRVVLFAGVVAAWTPVVAVVIKRSRLKPNED
jgi:hypothetical protein